MLKLTPFCPILIYKVNALMKKPNDDLFQLIQAMSAAEKRYFKRHYASNKNQTTDLFDFINGMESYDEDLVKQEFIDSKLSTNLKVYKVQLAELVFKSLVSYHNKNNPDNRIRSILQEVDILMDKSLYHLAAKRIKNLRTYCIKNKAYIQLLAVIKKGDELIDLGYLSVSDWHSQNQEILEELKEYFSKK